MRKRSMALAVIALMATAMALYVEIFERRPSPEEALAEPSPEARIPAQPHAEAEATEPGDDDSVGPLPDAVLRRSESGKGSALQQVRDSQDEQRAALIRVQERLDNLTLQTDQSSRALHRDLDQLRAEVRRDREASGKVRLLLMAALVLLILDLLISLWPSGRQEPPA